MPRTLRLLIPLFTLTGATALLVEQAFEKLLSTLLGASTPAAATVLAVYFGGLTLGGIAYGRLRVARPLRVYAYLELGVGLWALFLAVFFDKLIVGFTPLLAAESEHFAILQLLRLFVAACWILPATIPMGATFPAIVDALERADLPDRSQAITRFYSYNLLGAILAAALGPFLVFPYLGLDGALGLGFGLNLTVAFIAWRTAPPATPASTQVASATPPVAPWLLGLAFTSGFVFFALEIVWAHLIGAVLGNSVYAFAAMLTMVLLGLGIGGAITARRSKLALPDLGQLLIISALILVAFNGLWPTIPQTLAALGQNITTFAAAESLKWAVAAIAILPAATVLGMIYPSLFRLDSFPAHAQGRAAGRLLAANAIGCIGGALACGFGLIPRLGSEWTLTLLTGLCLIWGVAITARQPSRRLWIYVTVCVVFWAIMPAWNRLQLTSGRHVYFRISEVVNSSRLLFFHEDTHGGLTTVVENDSPQGVYRTLLTNGKFQGNDSWEKDAQTGFAQVPIMFVPHRARALVIGLGTGHSAQVVQEAGFRQIAISEIAPGIVTAARDFFSHVNGRVLDEPNVRLLVEDGRNVLLLRPDRYDLITMEISSVWFAGATSLYSADYYRVAKGRLEPGGILQQWIQLHHIGTAELESVIATLRSVFPHVSVWVIGGQGILVASETPQLPQPPQPGDTWDTAALLRQRVLDSDAVTRLAQRPGIVINTDRNRHLEYFTPRYNYSPRDHLTENIAALKAWAQ